MNCFLLAWCFTGAGWATSTVFTFLPATSAFEISSQDVEFGDFRGGHGAASSLAVGGEPASESDGWSSSTRLA